MEKKRKFSKADHHRLFSKATKKYWTLRPSDQTHNDPVVVVDKQGLPSLDGKKIVYDDNADEDTLISFDFDGSATSGTYSYGIRFKTMSGVPDEFKKKWEKNQPERPFSISLHDLKQMTHLQVKDRRLNAMGKLFKYGAEFSIKAKSPSYYAQEPITQCCDDCDGHGQFDPTPFSCNCDPNASWDGCQICVCTSCKGTGTQERRRLTETPKLDSVRRRALGWKPSQDMDWSPDYRQRCR
jgi:hypothetical protein